LYGRVHHLFGHWACLHYDRDTAYRALNDAMVIQVERKTHVVRRRATQLDQCARYGVAINAQSKLQYTFPPTPLLFRVRGRALTRGLSWIEPQGRQLKELLVGLGATQ
jgi:hypothetical protein